MKHVEDPAAYYRFDDDAREVRFLRPDTPTPWMNYLSNGTFHVMVSQAGGALAFHRSPQIWRINRYRFFHLPCDRSGLYVYIQDVESGEFWCPTAEPAKCRPDQWQAAHGLGYTRFEARRGDTSVSLRYFVGALQDNVIWQLKLRNDGRKRRAYRVYAYVELGMMEFMREMQWYCYNKHQLSVRYDRTLGALIYKYGVEMQPKPDETPLVYLAADRVPDAYDGDRDEFIGTYRSEENPYAIEHGGCTDSTLAGGDPCGALQFNVELEAGKSQDLSVFLGTGMNVEAIAEALRASRADGFVSRSLAGLRDRWTEYLESFQASVPDPQVQRMINTWNPYQLQRNFQFSRNLSYYATGTFRGVGLRDTAQDALGMIPFDPAAAREKTTLLLTQQYADGHANHYFFPTEGWPPVTSVHSDDHLWLILAIYALVMEAGDLGYLDKVVPYFDGGEGTVWDHLRRAVDFTQNHLGRNGFPLMLRSDWNDALFRVCREGKGESLWTAMQFGTCLQRLTELARLIGQDAEASRFELLYEQQKELVNRLGWDGAWYRRAVMDDGRFLGTREHAEGQIWLNAQSWAVISGMAQGDRGRVAMDSVHELLDTPLGIKKVHPPIVSFPSPEDPLTNYHPGTGENGSVFCHANTWAIIAECMLGRSDRAFDYYRKLIPAVAMRTAGVRRYKAEPYVYSSNIFGPDSDKFGLANVSWLTGTAAWMYVAVTQHILGVQPTWEGLRIDPRLPSGWDSATVSRRFRGCLYQIEITRSAAGDETTTLEVDGRPLRGQIIPATGRHGTVLVKVTVPGVATDQEAAAPDAVLALEDSL